MGVRQSKERTLVQHRQLEDEWGGRGDTCIPFLRGHISSHTLGAQGHPCDIPQQGKGLSRSPSEGERTGAHSRERQKLEDEAAEMGDGAEGGQGGRGWCLDMKIHGMCVSLHCPASP